MKATATRPSRLIRIDDRPWVALCFDNAVTFVGDVIDGARQEMENRGSDDKPRWELKYTMRELLDPEFRLPVDDEMGDISEVKGIEGIIYDEVG